MKQSNTSILLRLCVLAVTFVLVGADVVGLAQNTNSSAPTDTTMQNDNATMNANMGGSRRGRRGTRRRSSRSTMNANTGDMPDNNANMAGENMNMAGDNMNMAGEQNTNMAGDTSMQGTNDNTGMSGNMNMNTGGRRRRGRRRGTMTPMPAADTAPPTDMATPPADTSGAMASGGMMQGGAGSTLGRVGDAMSLDGTYAGTINYPDGGMSGDATLTITGNTFTLGDQSGTLTTQTWPGYTAVSMRFGTELPAKIISLRAKKTGSGLTLTSVSGESHQFSFHSGGGGGGAMGGRRRRRRGGRRMMAPPAEPPAETTTPPPGV